MKALLTYDIGTTACKTMLFGLDGSVVGMAEKEYKTTHPEPMWAEQDPDDWWRAVVETTRTVVGSREGLEIVSIGLSSQRETIVPVDREGAKLSNAIIWMDRRTRPEADALAEHYGRERLHAITGMIPDATFSATKLWWLKKNAPEIIDKAYKFLQPKEYVCLRLTGEFTTDYSLASRTMMLEVKSQKWFDDIFSVIGVPKEKMPRIYRSDEVVGNVTASAAATLGIQSGVPVVAGGGDRACEALGAGIFGTRAMESTGTTSNVSCASDHVIEDLDPRVICSSHTIPGHWLIEQGMTTSGSILRWFRDSFCQEELSQAQAKGTSAYELINREVEASPAGANKLLLLPFFMGARSTRWNPMARGAMIGLTLDTRKGDVARAIMEGVAFEIRACLDVLVGMGLKPTEIISMGGGSRGDVWNQIKADIGNRTVSIPRVSDAASLGAAILAGKGAGVFDDLISASLSLNPVCRAYRPNRANVRRYDELYGVYNEFYASVEKLYSRIDAIE